MTLRRSRLSTRRPEAVGAARPEPGAPTARPDAEPDEFWGTILALCFSVRDWWVAVCDELDLTPSQGLALRCLDRPLPMSTLAEELVCDASNVTGIVDKLESRGLIARRGADHDRRIKMLVITERGRALRDRLVRRLVETPAAVAGIPREVKSGLCERLRGLIGELNLARTESQAENRRRPLRAARG
jgi:DNA-binding MarR family transcriptional regulator